MVNTTRGSMARPCRSPLKYPNYKKDANPNVHVTMFQVAIRVNGETFEEYIINAFNYTLREMRLD
jgi:hypothetical protein